MRRLTLCKKAYQLYERDFNEIFQDAFYRRECQAKIARTCWALLQQWAENDALELIDAAEFNYDDFFTHAYNCTEKGLS